MALAARIIFSYPKCCFHTGFPVQSKLQQVMGKFVRESKKKRKWYPDDGSKRILATPSMLANTKHEHGKSSSRRVITLNKLFMSHITDQMSSGDIAAKLYGRKIEISKVKIARDFNIVNIYWLAKGLLNDAETENILKDVSAQLRHELSQLKIIGRVPKLQFVKDLSSAKIMELEMQLAKADFGEDFTPTDPSYLLKSEYMLNMRIEPHIVEKIQTLDSKESFQEIELPPMTSNIYGLDRTAILNRITSSKIKTIQAWKGEWKIDNRRSLGEESNSADVNLNTTSHLNDSDQFKEFLKKRQIAQMREIRRSNKIKPIVENDIEDDDNYYNDIENQFSDDYENTEEEYNVEIESLK